MTQAQSTGSRSGRPAGPGSGLGACSASLDLSLLLVQEECLMVEVFWLGEGARVPPWCAVPHAVSQFILGSPLHTVASPALVLPQ